MTQANLQQFSNAMHIANKDEINLKAFNRDEMVAIMQNLRKIDPIGHSAYLGENSTPEQINEAVVSVTYCKVMPSGRKYVGGPSYTVVIDHDKLNHGDTKFPQTGKREHKVVVKIYKRKDKTGYYLYSNIFDGKKIA